MSALGVNVLALGCVATGSSPFVLVPGLLWTALGVKDLSSRKTMRVNFPGLIWLRYIIESFRPELRQYLLESDIEENPVGMVLFCVLPSCITNGPIGNFVMEDRNDRSFSHGGSQVDGHVGMNCSLSSIIPLQFLRNGDCIEQQSNFLFPRHSHARRYPLQIARIHRVLIYQRAKNRAESQPFGTRHDVYETGYEWMNHSNLGARHVDPDGPCGRTTFGLPNDPNVVPYNASRLNISGMSYGALSHAAVKALNTGAKMGGFFHNTGEGGVSEHHSFARADVVWNVGTGYFGCRDFVTGRFSDERFLGTLERAPEIVMIELKLSQGAKPGHGGILPAGKLTQEIANIRGVPMGQVGGGGGVRTSRSSSVLCSSKQLLPCFPPRTKDLCTGREAGEKLFGRKMIWIPHFRKRSGFFGVWDSREGLLSAACDDLDNRSRRRADAVGRTNTSPPGFSLQSSPTKRKNWARTPGARSAVAAFVSAPWRPAPASTTTRR